MAATILDIYIDVNARGKAADEPKQRLRLRYPAFAPTQRQCSG